MLNEIEKDAIQLILSNQYAMSALEKIFNGSMEAKKPLADTIDNNTVLGEKYRAYELGKLIVRDAFLSLDGYRVMKKLPPAVNRGR